MHWTILLALVVVAQLYAEEYVLGPDSQRQPGVPAGTVTKQSWISKIYPGTTRDYWIYVPLQYRAEKPACLMIFQDGGGTITETGGWRVPIVFDNLIHKGEMPVTIGVFVNPGVLPAAFPDTQENRYNRSHEYDGLGDRYARFLIEEILPEVAKQYNLSKAPSDHAIAGSSSGGIGAFNAAWSRLDVFQRVVSFIGSFTNLRGGDTWPRASERLNPSRCVCSCRTGARIRTSTRAIGFSVIRRSIQHSNTPVMRARSSSARRGTTPNTAARFCRMRCGGFGRTIRNQS
jgi:enterochelin esterase family protein